MAIGSVYTPDAWADWLVERCDAARAWAAGGTIGDPTGGDGALLDAVIRVAERRGFTPTDANFARLVLIERDAEAVRAARFRFTGRPVTIYHRDVIRDNPGVQCDVLIGNPPWASFQNLPDVEKADLKPYFRANGLVGESRSLLLGASRVDLSALVVAIAVAGNLTDGGRAGFFLPAGLFFSDAAHAAFRALPNLRLDELYAFTESTVFPVGTKYAAAMFRRSEPRQGSVPFHRERDGVWTDEFVRPCAGAGSPFEIVGDTDTLRVRLRIGQSPRQGLNTCGANDVYFFDVPPDVEPALVYPLLTKANFRGDGEPRRFVLLPHDPATGRPLSGDGLATTFPATWRYLSRHRLRLSGRKGTLIQSHIRRGSWWALLGVGPYSFAPAKVVWEAYGRSHFRPQAVVGRWQPNQALQAYIPCADPGEARQLADELARSGIEKRLLAQHAGGTCNWAQPGRIKRFLEFVL
ncbi:MAG: hypothetical protein U0746_04585 [Gemmataceae bacterium]